MKKINLPQQPPAYNFGRANFNDPSTPNSLAYPTSPHAFIDFFFFAASSSSSFLSFAVNVNSSLHSSSFSSFFYGVYNYYFLFLVSWENEELSLWVSGGPEISYGSLFVFISVSLIES